MERARFFEHLRLEIIRVRTGVGTRDARKLFEFTIAILSSDNVCHASLRFRIRDNATNINIIGFKHGLEPQTKFVTRDSSNEGGRYTLTRQPDSSVCRCTSGSLGELLRVTKVLTG